MSKESAIQFLEAAARDTSLQEHFQGVTNPQEFIQVARALGYQFTTEELKAVVKEHSQGVTMRRQTGVWKWLRSVPWIDPVNSWHPIQQPQEAFGAIASTN